MIITLVITMMVSGQDIERQEKMSSMEACWAEAKRTMDEMRGPKHADAKITQIGVGCVVDLGDPL